MSARERMPRSPAQVRRLRRVALGAAAAGTLAAGAAGAVAGVLALPLAAALATQAWLGRRDRGPRESAQQVGLGWLALALGLVVLAFGAWAAAAVVVLAGGLAMVAGLAREDDSPWPEGVPRPHRLSPAAFLARAVDEGVRAVQPIGGPGGRRLRPDQVAADLRAATARWRAAGILPAGTGVAPSQPDALRAHPVPPSLEKVDLVPCNVSGLGPAETLTFESEFEPEDPEIRSDYLAGVENRRAHVVLSRDPAAARPALICVHGYGMGRPPIDARAFDVAHRRETLGIDVALFTLPLHGSRARGRSSGAGFLDGHPLATRAAIGQAVWDLRRLAGWLRAQGAPAVGVHGLSLGGYVAALLASLDRRLAVAVLSMPAVSLSDLLLRDRTADERQALDAAGLGRPLLEDAFAPHAVLQYPPRVASEGRLLVASALDRVCPPEHTLALWEHWQRPAIHWQPGGHLLSYGGRRTREVVDRHLRERLVAAAEAPRVLTRFRR